jgi:ribonucleotide monophosphatase NagD (HAD superfamily)
MKAVLTLTGVSSREDVQRLGIVPDLIVEHVDELADHL